jgi:hypothetical protein
MAYSTSFGQSKTGGGSGGSGGGANAAANFGRVVDVILDSSHPLFSTYKESQGINGIVYRQINSFGIEDEEGDLLFAYAGNNLIKKQPLKNEIVQIISMPSEERADNPNAKKTYWTTIVPLWNHPHHNAYPDTLQAGEGDVDLGEEFEEQQEVAPIQSFPGDTIIEGRHGNTVRLGGTKFSLNTFTDDSNNGSPYTIIRNGMKSPSNSLDATVEDINEDKSSIYMGADHTFELKQANEKRDAFEKEPEFADIYKGNQVIINSGRLFFNAKEEGIFLSAVEGIGINSKHVGIDGEDYVGLDAKKVYLGKKAFSEDEPVLLGQITTNWLEDFLGQFEQIMKAMATAPPVPAEAYTAVMTGAAKAIVPMIPTLKSLIKRLHSKKVFTE